MKFDVLMISISNPIIYSIIEIIIVIILSILSISAFNILIFESIF